ncbi:DUF1707 domain-containing protein [Rhodococcus hoagii]|uniref:DUF1707 domain-containing protein n=1 Tax=Rhodococcus hoagii TaxID=43767 RepID=A0AAE2W584_RHOHA|nr:DUF1707 domain-containing protein [Prescottella equi]MBM4492400.1 DUF1707 domain-containing protein [Prescottella equi]MBM4541489.1 DUF1707 domain-containing protein [Prescottella equi]MBM4714219.1 DUF1707 domain-containing protein [Prescottella equi]NKS10985.1 DUF1707 domain-containing protein [Prescottella equi]ORL36039.1 hypothetical protein A6I87_12195 [Prescottella equi]
MTVSNRLPGRTPTRIRARDVDRTAVRAALDAAFTDGQLSHVEHRRRTEAAQSARTRDDLDRLVGDLQAPPTLSGTTAPTSMSTSTRWAVALSAAVVLICGIVAVTSDRDVVPASSGASSVELTTAAGFGRMLDDIEHQLGSGEVDRLIVYPEYASISRAVVGAPGSEQSYRYEDGHLTDNGRSPGRTAGVPVDLAELRPNVARLMGLLYGADRTLGVSDPTQVYLIAQRDDDDGSIVSVHVTDENTGAQGFMTVGFDGEVRSVYRADR